MTLKSGEYADPRVNASLSGSASQQPSPNYSFDDDSRDSSQSWITHVELPSNATATTIPANAQHGRSREMRYIKLPWTHDETDLASGHGGFAHGCALIAEALGIDSRYWYAAKIAADADACSALQDDASLDQVQTNPSPGKVLVHCQCGVSRSATLVIAFVMQAAAMRYGFEAARTLLGMHDCYNMVKEKSSSISPNISLIYQLVEWERYLSNAAGRLRDMLGLSHGNVAGASGTDPASNGSSSLAAAGWSTEPMDEAMWSKMRLEEEEKEAAEEARRREERLNEAVRLAAERKAAQDQAEGRDSDNNLGGDAGVGSLMQRRRKKAAPALQLQPPAAPTPTAGALMPSPGLNRRRPPALRLGSGSKADVEGSKPRADADGDVMMNELDPPQTPLRSSAADSDIVSTPTARTTAASFGPDSASSTLRTPVAWSSSSAMPTVAPEFMKPKQPLSSSFDLAASAMASGHLSAGRPPPTTLLSPASPAMATSRSAENHANRFSFGGAPMSGSLSARLDTADKRSRPGSMQGAMSSSSSSTALFGVTALSREERKKQHRRTFSSDWPALQANLGSQRRGSKVGSSLASPAIAGTETAAHEHGYADMDV
uniref:protein-tyrosine-phosphatase n=2 Tax=Kalmanozyma brasiliensis (strain GHG001) TaxID=1365824 RepID=V5EWX5_KALBG